MPQRFPLPDEVKRLIVRKLQKFRREFDLGLVERRVQAIADIETGIGAALRERKFAYAMTTLPLSAYRALAAKTMEDVQGLPLALWETTKSTMESVQGGVPTIRSELIGLLEDFTWRATEINFVLRFLDAASFLAAVRRSLDRRGLNDTQMLDRLEESILHRHALITVAIGNVARRGREAAEIAIDAKTGVRL